MNTQSFATIKNVAYQLYKRLAADGWADRDRNMITPQYGMMDAYDEIMSALSVEVGMSREDIEIEFSKALADNKSKLD